MMFCEKYYCSAVAIGISTKYQCIIYTCITVENYHTIAILIIFCKDKLAFDKLNLIRIKMRKARD